MKILKYCYIFSLLIFTPFLAQAQDLEARVSQGTCDCLEKKDLSGMDMDAFTMEMGMCMVTQLITEDPDEMAKSGLVMTDESSMEAFGGKIGMRLSSECPSFLSKIMELMSEEDSELVEEIKKKKGSGATKEFGSTTGTFVSIESNDFAKITVKDAAGKNVTFYWIKQFEGSDQFMGKQSKKLKGKTLNINFVEYEAYIPKAEAYFKIKEIKSIEVE